MRAISQILSVGQFCIDVYNISTFESHNFMQIQISVIEAHLRLVVDIKGFIFVDL
jgi:hypothetical protein